MFRTCMFANSQSPLFVSKAANNRRVCYGIRCNIYLYNVLRNLVENSMFKILVGFMCF